MRRLINIYYLGFVFLLKNQVSSSKSKNPDLANITPGIPLGSLFFN